jgi:hypothetical protein
MKYCVRLEVSTKVFLSTEIFCVAGLVFSDIAKERNVMPSSLRVGPINV